MECGHRYFEALHRKRMVGCMFRMFRRLRARTLYTHTTGDTCVCVCVCVCVCGSMNVQNVCRTHVELIGTEEGQETAEKRKKKDGDETEASGW